MDSDREIGLKIQDGLLFLGFFLFITSFLLPATKQNSSEWISPVVSGWEAFLVSFAMIFEIAREWQMIYFHLLFWTNIIMASAFVAMVKRSRLWMRRLCILMICSFLYMAGFYIWVELLEGEKFLGYGYLVWSSSFLIISILLVLKLRQGNLRYSP